MYRLATDDELINAGAKIRELTYWNSVKAYVEKWYSAGVVKVELDLRGESDDEGGTNWSIESLTCTDANGNYVEIDFESDYWQKLRQQQIDEATTGREAALDAWRNVVSEYSWYGPDDVQESVQRRSEALDETLEFWKQYDAADPEDRPDMLEEHFEDEIDEERSAIEFDHDDTTFDLTVKPTVPVFYVEVPDA